MRKLLFAVAIAVCGCATLADPAGDENAVRPNAQAGPFRGLQASELPAKGPSAPYVLNDGTAHYRQSCAVDLDGTGRLGRVALYVVADRKEGTGIYRFVSPDGCSFGKTPDPATPVLMATEAWEGSFVGEPDVHIVDGKLWMLYEAAGGIGLARSDDGVTFTRAPGPVLGPDASVAWEGGKVPGAPNLLRVSASDFRLFYAVNDRIGEARSSDGLSFARSPDGPLLGPLGGSGEDAPFDSDSIGDPYAVLATSAEGRRITRVYYAGGGTDGRRGIGLAARFGVDGPLTRAAAPVFPITRDARSPAVLAYDGFALLYATERGGGTSALEYPAIAAGIAPGNASIPLP